MLVLFSFTSFGLKVGDEATGLNVKEWIKNGPVQLKKGNIYVIEFWATWCPPCRTSIPHLSMLQKKHKKDGLVIVGISDESKPKVAKFVKKQSNMDYSVAADAKGEVYKTYMKEYRGIPKAFVVDKKGIIVWVGHPMALDDIIVKVIKGEKIPKNLKKVRKFDSKKELKKADEKIKLNKNDAKAHLNKLWLSYDLNISEKWLEAFEYLDKNDKLKTTKWLEPFYKAKEILNNIKLNKSALALEELEEALKHKNTIYRQFILTSPIYYNYIKVQKGEKNLFNNDIKSALLAKIDYEVKIAKKYPSHIAYMLNLKSYLQATFKDYKAAIQTENEALKFVEKLKDDYISKPILIKLLKDNISTYEKKVKNTK